MSDPIDTDAPGGETPRGTARKIAVGALVCVVAVALGIGYLVSSQASGVSDAGASATPAASVDAEPTGTATNAGEPDPAEATNNATEAEEPAAETPDPTETPTGGGTTPAASDPAGEPTQNDAELAAIDQPVSEPVDLEEPSVVAEGLIATISGMEAIDAEAFGIGEIAGPALRFEITVENTTAEAVSLGNAVVNVEYGPERSPAVQLTGSGATAFPATVDAGGSVATTLVFSVPADQRDQVRILLNVEASSPIAAFVGAAPGEEG